MTCGVAPGNVGGVKVWVVLPTKGRAELLHATVSHLERQTVPVDGVLVSVMDPADVLPCTRALPSVTVCLSEPGSATQRNTAIRAVPADVDHLVFIDDDTLLHPTFVAEAVSALERHPDVVALTGALVLDGAAIGRPITVEEAERVLHSLVVPSEAPLLPREGILGGVSAVRADVCRRVLFDERLQAYALHEDLDFGVRCAREGRVVTHPGAVAVHLGIGSGRTRGLALGVAQIINPWYLFRKGSLNALRLTQLWSHYLVANCLRHLVPRPRSDRVGRLRGNLAALAIVLGGQGRPEVVRRFL